MPERDDDNQQYKPSEDELRTIGTLRSVRRWLSILAAAVVFAAAIFLALTSGHK